METGFISDRAACYAAFRAKDARFDGRLYISVLSTGIYCRPVCTARLPREKNCTFHPSAAAAEAAGFRACRICRPELAPGPAFAEGLAGRAARLMEEHCLAGGEPLSALPERLGVTDRHLRRVFREEFGVPPAAYLQTRRLALARNLLRESRLSVTETALAAGFGSLRRFNDLFQKRCRTAPSAFRRRAAAGRAGTADGVTVRIGFRPPYQWDTLLAFLGSRAVPCVEEVRDGEYRRSAAAVSGGREYRGWLTVSRAPAGNALAVTVSPSLLPALPAVLARVRHLFDTDASPQAAAERLEIMNVLSPGLFVPGIRVPGCFNAFEMAVRAVLGQQITVKAARTLAGRIAEHFGEPLETPFPAVTRIFPGPETFCRPGENPGDLLGPLGVIGARARSIAALAGALTRGEITLSPAADPQREIRLLQTLPGFGPWTAQYIAMRALAWPDAFPHTDLGIRKALGGRTDREILALAEEWRPWRAYAAFALWHSLE